MLTNQSALDMAAACLLIPRSPPQNMSQGMIGIAMNGLSIFSDADAMSRDAYVYEGSTFDACRSHSSESQRQCRYLCDVSLPRHTCLPETCPACGKLDVAFKACVYSQLVAFQKSLGLTSVHAVPPLDPCCPRPYLLSTPAVSGPADMAFFP